MYNVGVKSFRVTNDEIVRGQIVSLVSEGVVDLYDGDGYPIGITISDADRGGVAVYTRGRTFEVVTSEAIDAGDPLAYDTNTSTWILADEYATVAAVALSTVANEYGGIVEAALIF